MKIILEEVNKHFNDGLRANSTDMQVEFVMATHTPDGEQLAEPGVERVKVGFSHVHPIKFLVEYSQPDLLWDTEKYINIFICGFLPPYGSSHGYSMTSYSVMPSALEGLEVLDFWPTHDDVNYMHSIVVNNLHIYKLNSLEQFDKNFSTAAAPSSIAYDLGSYLGLFDIYSMSEDGDCADTDYCADTPCYDRDKYRTQADEYIATHRPFTSDVIKEVIKRTDCVTGEISRPNNVMDLFYSWRNRFTPDQKKRVRHVLTYSPLLPGPKIKPETKALNSKGTRVLVPKHIK